MAKVSLGIFGAIKNIKTNFSKLPSEAKTTYFIVGGILVVVLFFLIKFFVPDNEKKLELPSSSSSIKSRGGSSKINTNTEIPNQLASEIIENRESLRNDSSVVFSRYTESSNKLREKKSQFADSLKIDITEVPTVDKVLPTSNEKATEEEVNVIENENQDTDTENADMFLGVVKTEVEGEYVEPKSDRAVLRQLMSNEEIKQLWMQTISASQNSNSQNNSAVSVGNTVSFSREETEKEPVYKDGNPFSTQFDDDVITDTYDGDDFQPGRVVLARIDGLIESDTNTPFIRLRPVEGPREWVEDAIFLAQPELIEGQGYQIMVKSVTHKNKSGNFSAVAVTPDDKRSAVIVDEIDSRELERLGYIVSGGFLAGLNNLASRIGTTVQTQNGTVSNVEIDGETLAVSAFGGIGRRGEGYLFDKAATTKDNHIISQNKLVGIMILEKPDMLWLPELDNRNVY